MVSNLEKLNTYQFIIFIQNNLMQTIVSYKELVIDKEYIIYRAHDNIFWKGIFRGEYQRYYEEYPNLIFVNCIQSYINLYIKSECHTMNLDNWKNRADFRKTDIFHDVEKVKENSKYAIQNMEKRSLDMILKSLVNEEFEW